MRGTVRGILGFNWVNATATSTKWLVIPEGAIGSLFIAVVNNDYVHELHRQLMHCALCSLCALSGIPVGLLYIIVACSFKWCSGSLWSRPWRISQLHHSACCISKWGQLLRALLNHSIILNFFILGRNLVGTTLQQSHGLCCLPEAWSMLVHENLRTLSKDFFSIKKVQLEHRLDSNHSLVCLSERFILFC